MKITWNIKGREALPLRAVPLVTDWYVTPQAIAHELTQPPGGHGLTAHRQLNGQVTPVRASAWGPLDENIEDMARAFKAEETWPDQHRQRARRESLARLPAGVFIWLEDFENWYSRSYVGNDTAWQELHRVVAEDEDPEPGFIPTRQGTLDLSPLCFVDFETLISEGFQADDLPRPESVPHPAAAEAPTDVVAAAPKPLPTAGDPVDAILANRQPEGKGWVMKKAALIRMHAGQWESIDSDFNNASVNGLSKAAKAPAHGEWFEAAALGWARKNGKLEEPGDKTPLNSIFQLPGTRHEHTKR